VKINMRGTACTSYESVNSIFKHCAVIPVKGVILFLVVGRATCGVLSARVVQHDPRAVPYSSRNRATAERRGRRSPERADRQRV